jgi:hypothetical protein
LVDFTGSPSRNPSEDAGFVDKFALMPSIDQRMLRSGSNVVPQASELLCFVGRTALSEKVG